MLILPNGHLFQITLPVQFYTDEGIKMQEMGMEINIQRGTEWRDVIFFVIDSIEPYIYQDDEAYDGERCIIFSGGQQRVIDKPRDEVLSMISAQISGSYMLKTSTNENY